MNEKNSLLTITNLTKHFPIKTGFFNKTVGYVQALTNLNLNIYKGETLGLVGESGCGKSTAGRCILNLLKSDTGQVFIEGEDILKLDKKTFKEVRKKMQIIFQNPYSSLDPRMTVKDIIAEPLIIHCSYSKAALNSKISTLLDMVGLPQNTSNRYPHEFSGGQRQRVGIARALALNPIFIVADEPVSALDVSIQAQILNLLEDLKKELNLTYLFISHNLSVVNYISDRVAVMYLGQIVELADSNVLYKTPKHPYTNALLGSISMPEVSPDKNNVVILEGDVPSPNNPPSGCKFHTRCKYFKDICIIEEPSLKEYSSGHLAKCHFAGELDLAGIILG